MAHCNNLCTCLKQKGHLLGYAAFGTAEVILRAYTVLVNGVEFWGR